jgi:tetratricopeptide (TPR) repeat protein
MSQPFYKKAGVQGAMVAGIFLLIVTILTILFAKEKKTTVNAQKIIGASNSPITQVNQASNATVNNNSGNITLNNQGVLNNPQAPLYAPGSTFNYYSTPVTNTVTREAFETFEQVVSNAVSNTTERVELTAQQVQLLAQALRDLDQRTSDIEKLPDGRTKFGNYVAGKPKIVIEAFDEGIQHYTNKNFQAALENFQKAIAAFEISMPSDVAISSGGITPKGEAAAYWYASICAQRLGSNDLANTFAEKAVKRENNWQTKELYTTTLATLAENKLIKNDSAAAFDLYKTSITNFESIDWSTNKIPSFASKLYSEASLVASVLGKTNEATEWIQKAHGF